MKVFVTLATVLGVSSASPLLGNFGRHNDFRSTMAGRHMPGRQMSDRQMSDRQMSDMDMSRHQYSGMDQMQGRQDMHQDRRYDNVMGMSGRQFSDRHMSEMGHDDRQLSGDRRQYTNMNMADRQMSGMNMADRQMSGMRMGNQQMSMRSEYRQDERVQEGVDQYYKQDDFGNYAYGYANGNSEKFEVGNPQSGVKGHYTYVDSNGLSQKVEYVADDEGFRIVGKDEHMADQQMSGRNMADRHVSGMRMGNHQQQHNRFTRSAIEPSVMRSQMTSYMVDFPSLVDDDMLQVERNMYRNGMSLNNDRLRFNNVMSGNRQMSDRQMADRQMYDREMSRDMHYRDEPSMMNDNMRRYDNVMGNQQMFDRQISERQMSVDGKRKCPRGRGKCGGNLTADNLRRYDNVMGNQQMFDRQMSERQMSTGNRFFPSTFGLSMYSMDNMNMDNMRINDGVLGEQSSLSQRMEIERIPDNRMSSYRMF